MTINDTILEAADAIAKRIAGKIDSLKRDSEGLEAQLQQKKLELSVIQAGPKRRATFSVYDGAKIVCPACWIERSERAVLDPCRGTLYNAVRVTLNNCLLTRALVLMEYRWERVSAGIEARAQLAT